jgi:hypothetical protein
MPVFVTWSKPEGPDPLSILAHQLRRRFRSNSSLLRGAKPVYQTARPEGSLVLRPVRPAFELDPKTNFAAKTVRCSTALLGSTTLASRFAHHDPQGTAGTASRLRKIDSSGASYRPTPKKTRKLFSLPAGGDRTFGHLPHRLAVAGCLERPGPPSRSQLQHAHLFRVAKAKNEVRSLWITGISGTTAGTFSDSPESPSFGCRSVPLRLLPPSA